MVKRKVWKFFIKFIPHMFVGFVTEIFSSFQKIANTIEKNVRLKQVSSEDSSFSY